MIYFRYVIRNWGKTPLYGENLRKGNLPKLKLFCPIPCDLRAHFMLNFNDFNA